MASMLSKIWKMSIHLDCSTASVSSWMDGVLPLAGYFDLRDCVLIPARRLAGYFKESDGRLFNSRALIPVSRKPGFADP